MDETLEKKIFDLLDQHRLMTVATNRPDGWPQAFGLGFFLLARPNEGLIAGPEARDRSVTIEARPPDLAPSPDKDGASSATQTASASSVSPAQPERHYGVLPPASDDTAPGSAIAADTGAAKATFGG